MDIKKHFLHTRYQFFLQLKLDLLSGKLECPYATSVDLAAASLQCKSMMVMVMVMVMEVGCCV